jgi:hypothetical protein
MAHYLTSDDKYRGLPYGDEDRSSLGGYQFGRTHGKRVRGRAALSRVNGYLKAMIEAIANSKLRRMERELELRGIRFHRPDNDCAARNPARPGVRED